MSRADLYLSLGAVLFALGAVRLLLARRQIVRIIALNVAGAGSLVVLGALAFRIDPEVPDPVLHALVLTGIVITVSVTGLALVMLRLLGQPDDGPGGDDD